MHRQNYDDLKENMMGLEGIGDKVADCILLYGYGKLNAFPIDTWVKRVVENVYFANRKRGIGEIHDFAIERWGEHAGYAQQYLFHYGRERKIGR